MNHPTRLCQSCGMPLENPEHFGTDADGSVNTDYCIFCYRNGEFLQQCTMEEMIELCAPFSEEIKHEDGRPYTREEGVELMRRLFPTLARWR